MKQHESIRDIFTKIWGHVAPGVHVVTDILPGDLHQLLVNVQPDDPLGIVLTAQRDRHVTCSNNNITAMSSTTTILWGSYLGPRVIVM